MKVIFIQLIRIILIFSLVPGITGCKVSRIVVYNKADIHDHKKFPSRELQVDSVKFEFFRSEQEQIPHQAYLEGFRIGDFDDFLKATSTVAFLIIRHDTILYERYFEDYGPADLVPSFSMAKAIFSTLIGCAIDDGLIASVKDPITRYVPELKEKGFEKVTIEHLLQMTSGVRFNENYKDPFAAVTTLYYGTNLKKTVLKMKMEKEPGAEFKYVSGNTQLLGLALQNVLGEKTITRYFSEKLWLRMGMEYPGSWSIDSKKHGLEKTFCCINATARDFAKIGRLYLHHGNWNGDQLVSEEWIENSTRVDSTNGSQWNYQYNWWLPTTTGDYMARGKGGQMLYVDPEYGVIIVRLGIKNSYENWPALFYTISRGRVKKHGSN